MYTLRVRGLAIECETIDELRAAVGAFAGEVEDVESSDPVAKSKPARPPTTAAASKRGSGPAKSWSMARWYAAKNNKDHKAARAELAKLRRSDFTKYQKIEAEYYETQD